jgi:zinc transport system ATP-binding protein
MSEPAIACRDLSVSIGGKQILEDVDLTVCPQDFFAIIGPNGSGKTTLLRAILGLVHPQQGSIRIFGGPPRENRKLLGYVPQFRTFDFSYPVTVMEMVLSGRLGHITRPLRRYGDDDYDHALRALETMEIESLADRELRALSGGQQQRAIIARALAGEPRVLLLDEPTVYVDAPTEKHFFDILEQLRPTMAIVLVTHDIGAISTRVTKVACLNRRIYTHDTAEITEDMLTAAYHCPVDLIAHGVPHRVLREHDEEE